MKRVVVFTGAGISAESGIRTFRDSGGLWEEYPIEEVATPEAWARNPERVLEFYNLRRVQVSAAQPNPAHYALERLRQKFDLKIITQNIDDLHERAGSLGVLHLHGEIRKARSTSNSNHVVELEGDYILPGDSCPYGSQLRPHIVWFGESVPAMDEAIALTEQADYFLVIGTSLAVYPAASLVFHVPSHAQSWLIDPNPQLPHGSMGFNLIQKTASAGVPELVDQLLQSDVY
jgi:NAD-dependent deacetylase